MSKNKHAAAFPLGAPIDYPHGNPTGPSNHGLTKRELLAAMAMQGLVSGSGADYDDDIVARNAVRVADRLIEELERAELNDAIDKHLNGKDDDK